MPSRVVFLIIFILINILLFHAEEQNNKSKDIRVPLLTQYDLYYSHVQIRNESFNILWDTGTTTNAVDSEFLISIGATKDVAYNSKAKVTLKVPLSNLKANISFLPYDFSKINKFIDIDCIIGYPLFNTFTVEFDFNDCEIILHNKDYNIEKISDSTAYSFTFEICGFKPIIECKINGQFYKMLIDTGYNGGIGVVDKKYIISSEIINYEGLIGTGFFENKINQSYIKVDDVEILNEVFKDIYIRDNCGNNTTIDKNGNLSTPTDFQLMVGTAFFKDCLLVLDYQNKKGLFLRKKGSYIPPFPMPFRIDNDLTIQGINVSQDNNPFRRNDRIISVNGNTNISYDDIRYSYGRTTGNTYTLIRDGSQITIQY